MSWLALVGCDAGADAGARDGAATSAVQAGDAGAVDAGAVDAGAVDAAAGETQDAGLPRSDAGARKPQLAEGPCDVVPGPKNAPFRDHVAKTKLSKRLPDEFKKDPDYGIPTSTTTLMMTAHCGATVGEVNQALCSAPVNVVNAMTVGILVLQVRNVRDFSDLDDAIAILRKHRSVAAVATNPMVGLDDEEVDVPRGTRSRPKKRVCEWAPAQIAKHYELTPHRCSDEAIQVDGRDVHLGVVRIDVQSTIYAIVDDAGVHPLRLHTPSADAAGNVLDLSAREIKTQVSPKLTGQQHWSQKTKRGWHWVDVAVHRSNGRVPRVPNPFGDLRASYSKELAQLADAIRPCMDAYVVKHPEVVGEPVRVDWTLERTSRVNRARLFDLGDKRLNYQIDNPGGCIRNELNRLHMKFPPDHEKVNRILFTERLVIQAARNSGR